MYAAYYRRMSVQNTNLGSRALALPASTWIVAGFLLCHLPLAVVYYARLSSYDHYLFWPFALASIAYFVSRRIAWEKFRLSIPGWFLLAVDATLVLGSGLLGSPWLSVAGLVCLMLAIAVSASDKATGRAPIELPLLMATTVRPPANIDLALIQSMQLQTTRLSGEILDRLNVLHVRSGNLIELLGKQLFVEEACSGIQSLFTLIFLAAFIAGRKRRPFLHTIMLLLAAPICAIPMNIARVTSIALGWHTFKLDLSSGILHDLLGYLLLLAAATFLWSADQLGCFFSNRIKEDWAIDRTRPFDNPFVRTWNWFWKQIPAVRSMRVGAGRRTAIVCLLVAGCLGGLQCLSLFAGESKRVQARPEIVESLQLPEQIGGLELSGQETEARPRSSTFGAYSARWKYTDGATEYVVSFDFPFLDWHTLETCYEGIGWQVNSGDVIGEEWPVGQFEMSQPTGELAYLEYGFVDNVGGVVRPPQASDPGAAILNRLRKSGLPGTSKEIYQSQVIVFSTLPLTDSQQKRASLLHLKARKLLQTHLQQIIAEEGK